MGRLQRQVVLDRRVVTALPDERIDLLHSQPIVLLQDLPQHRLKLLLLGKQGLQEGDNCLFAPIDLVMVAVCQQAHDTSTSHGLTFV